MPNIFACQSYICITLYHRSFGDPLMHNLCLPFSFPGSWTVFVNCNTDYEAERESAGEIQGLFSGRKTDKMVRVMFFYALIYFWYLPINSYVGIVNLFYCTRARDSRWVLMTVAWILQRLLIPCNSLLSIGLLMPCFLGWSHRLVPWDAFEPVTSRWKRVLILTNVVGNRNPL